MPASSRNASAGMLAGFPLRTWHLLALASVLLVCVSVDCAKHPGEQQWRRLSADRDVERERGSVTSAGSSVAGSGGQSSGGATVGGGGFAGAVAGGSGGTAGTGGVGGAGGTGGAPVVVADFHLLDVNATSPTYNTLVSPRDYLQQISAWFFASAT